MAATKSVINSAVAGHPDVDLQKMQSVLTELGFGALSVVPYLTADNDDPDGKSALQREREEAVAQFKKIREAEEARKKRLVAEGPKSENLKIVPIGEKK